MADTEQRLVIESNITGQQFGRFAMYDTFVRRRAWRAPALFALMMSGFALVCFTLARDKEQSSLLGLVLLSVGLVLPTVWVFMYVLSVRRQIKKFGLSIYKVQYLIEPDRDGIRVTKGKEKADFSYKAVTMLVKDKGCSYLYVDKGRAFLLPEREKNREALAFLESRLPPEKIKKTRHV